MKLESPAPGDQSLTSSSIDLLDSFFSVEKVDGSLNGIFTDIIKNSITFIGANTIKVLMLRAAISQPPFLFNRSMDKFYGLLRVQSYDYSEQEILDVIKSLKKINDFYYNREVKVEHGLVPTYQMLRLTAWNTVERTVSDHPDVMLPLVRSYLEDKVNQLIGMIAPQIEVEDDTVLNGLPSYTAWREKDETLSHAELHYHHLTKQMHDDASNGNTSRFQEYLLQHQVDVNSFANSSGDTALMLAAKKGRADVVTALLEAGANPNATNDVGMTALMWAAWNGHVNVLDALLENGASINATNNHGDTALRLAAECGYFNVVARLLELDGIHVNATDGFGKTALMCAAWNGHVDVVKALLAAGADVNATRNGGMTALMLAAECGHVEVVKALLENGASINATDNRGMTALMMAAKCGHVEVVKALLNVPNIMLNATDNDGMTALMLAAVGGHVEVVKALLENGASINATDNDGMTALMLAAVGGRVDNDVGMTPLIWAAVGGRVDNDVGMTPLIWAAQTSAAREGRVNVVEALLAAGADVNSRDKSGMSALDYAQQRGHASIVALIQQHLSHLSAESLDDAKASSSESRPRP